MATYNATWQTFVVKDLTSYECHKFLQAGLLLGGSWWFQTSGGIGENVKRGWFCEIWGDGWDGGYGLGDPYRLVWWWWILIGVEHMG